MMLFRPSWPAWTSPNSPYSHVPALPPGLHQAWRQRPSYWHQGPTGLCLKAFFSRQWQQMSAAQFMAVFRPYAVRIGQVLDLFDAWAVAAAAIDPANLAAAPMPTIAGTAAKGQRLTARAGIWSPAPVTLRFQWKRSGLNIAGATGNTYLLGAADTGKTITVTVTGSKTGYTTLARTSAKTRVVRAR